MKLAAILVTFFILFLSFAFAQPMPPHQFYGLVNVNGEAAKDGLLITAKINDQEVASTTTKDGEYGHDPVFYIPNNGYNGEVVKFYVQGLYTGESIEYSTTNGAVREVDLSLEGVSFCGDGSCNGEEDCTSCPDDCGQCQTASSGSSSTSSAGSGGSSGGSGTSASDFSGSDTQDENDEDTENACTPDWTCSEWMDCISGTQKRVCVDSNRCGTDDNKPSEEKNCTDRERSENETNSGIDFDLNEEPQEKDKGQITGAFIGDGSKSLAGVLMFALVAGGAIIGILMYRRRN